MRAGIARSGGALRRCADAGTSPMSSERRAYWDERHREGTPGAPEPALVEMLPLMPRGLTLDIAAGLGRNAIALAEAGMRVIAADYSERATIALRDTARERTLAI